MVSNPEAGPSIYLGRFQSFLTELQDRTAITTTPPYQEPLLILSLGPVFITLQQLISDYAAYIHIAPRKLFGKLLFFVFADWKRNWRLRRDQARQATSSFIVLSCFRLHPPPLSLLSPAIFYSSHPYTVLTSNTTPIASKRAL